MWLALALVSWTSIAAQLARAQLPYQHCNIVHQMTDDVVELPKHKYVILEECLYYNLSQQADAQQGKHNALMTLPPTKGIRDTVEVNVEQMLIEQLWLNEMWKEMNVGGYMELEWDDYRFTWDASRWKIDELPIRSYGHIWIPDLFTGVATIGTASKSSDYTSFKDLRAQSNGRIRSKLQYRIQAQCEVNYKDYPADDRSCCFHLHSGLYADIVRFKAKTGIAKLSPNSHTNWHLSNISVSVQRDPHDGTETYKACITANRKSSTLKIELTVPIVISAAIVLISPLFGAFKSQLYVKLFSILLQFMCFQFLVAKTPQVGFGDEVPKIYKFYEFTLAMTMFSLIITLVCYALSRGERVLPPPHRLSLFAAAANQYLCCAEIDGSTSTSTKEGGGAAGSSKAWAEIYACANNVISLLWMIAYVLGVLVLCT